MLGAELINDFIVIHIFNSFVVFLSLLSNQNKSYFDYVLIVKVNIGRATK